MSEAIATENHVEVKLTRPESVVILGKGMTGIECPFDCEENWGVNNVAEQVVNCPQCKGTGKAAEIPCLNCKGVGTIPMYPHKFHKLFAFDILPKEYTDDMKKYGPIMSWQDYADIKFPLDDVIRHFNTRYFTNTISYMLAYACYLRIPTVKLYGVDVSFGAAYAQENRGVEYWIGRAQERGINFIAPDTSHLLRTVSGALYGERDHCNMLFYLNERINLINILPRQGTYSEALKAQNAWWVLFPKEDEAKAHNVVVQKDPAGNMNFQTPSGEFVSDIHMPPETWDYLRGLLRDLEKKGTLPFGVISAYEKLILAKPYGGN